MTTMTVIILNTPEEIGDYIEYLASEGWPVVRTREVDGGRFVQITFAIGK
jgi:hypothetical protein